MPRRPPPVSRPGRAVAGFRGIGRSRRRPGVPGLPAGRRGSLVGRSRGPRGYPDTPDGLSRAVAVAVHDGPMRLLLTPVRVIYRGLVWLANSPPTLILSYLLLIVVCSVLYRIFEDDVSIGDSLWWALVTASTVGYGDISPKTLPGRVTAAVLISVMVMIVVPLITAHFASKLIVDTDAFRHEEQ